jgi:hypothetical protein
MARLRQFGQKPYFDSKIAPMPQPTPERITIRHLINDLLLIANLEKGFGYTVKQLFR